MLCPSCKTAYTRCETTRTAVNPHGLYTYISKQHDKLLTSSQRSTSP